MKNSHIITIICLWILFIFPLSTEAASLTIYPSVDGTLDNSVTLGLTYVGPIVNDQVILDETTVIQISDIANNRQAITEQISTRFSHTDFQLQLSNEGQRYLPDINPGLYLLKELQNSGSYRLNLPILIQIDQDQTIALKGEEIQEPGVSTVTQVPKEQLDHEVIPFTGQSWWPVFTCVGLSLFFLLVSFIGGKKS